MVVLNFLGYDTKEMTFKKNDDYVERGRVSLKPKLGVEISQSDESNADITLSVRISGTTVPFKVFVKIKGYFSFELEEAEGLEFSNMLRVNGVAIMYPYVRALVTQLTSMSNEHRPYILPTINLVKALSESESLPK